MAYAIPETVQIVSGSDTGDRLDRGSPAESIYHIALVRPARAGNTIIIGVKANSGTTFTASDDQGNTYTVIVTQTGVSRVAAILIAENVAAGTQYIQVNGGTSYKQVVACEVMNVSGVDVYNGATGTNAAITAGAITPTVSGDYIWQVAYAMPQNQSYLAGPASADPNIAYALESSSDPHGRVQIVQSGIYNATSTFTPTMRQSSSGTFLSVAIALKGQAQGSDALPGMRARSVQHNSLYSSSKTNGPGFPSPCPLHFPCKGNLRVASVFQAGNSRITNFGGVGNNVDSKGNTWQKAGAGSGATQHFGDVWYTWGGTVGDDTIVTVTGNDTTQDSSVIFYDCEGALSTDPYDVSGGANGNTNTVAPILVSGPTVTPTAPGMAFGMINQSWDTVISMGGPTGVVFDATWDEKENLDGPVGSDQNGGFASVEYASGGAKTFVWNYFDSTWSGQNDYTSYVAAFKAQPPPPINVIIGEPVVAESKIGTHGL